MRLPHYDLGHGVGARRIAHARACPEREATHGLSGLVVMHTHDDLTSCRKFYPWCRHCAHGSLRILTLISIDPLTVSPAIGDPLAPDSDCGLYGRIVGGRWIPGGVARA